ncbi:hypothetical protein [Streptomyces cacaoi]|uniref:hypothetical protein n=1 Tax=Streptomyces cacaoi TaxID=1898 RepID=UPI00262ACE87|nr:hypothetical protein [Streptomyces cacaoi]
MTTPGGQSQQPNPYQTPGPYQPPPLPGGQPNPYAQPVGQPAMPAPPGPPAPGGGRGGPRWLWALGGAVLASAVWAATLMGTGALKDEESAKNGGRAHFAGYRFHHDMCETAKIASFTDKYEMAEFDQSEDPDGWSTRQKGLDSSLCSRTLHEPDNDSDFPPAVYVTTTVTWHKRSDPSGEFASQLRSYEDQEDKTSTYTIEPVEGLGDEAYEVIKKRGRTVGSMILAVRAGWMTYEMRFSWMGGGPDEHFEPPSRKKLHDMMLSDTRATLAALKKPDSEDAPQRDPRA